ncbi:hypothetical protein WDW37_07555 [Bdellovibrionota bacterium FG-1]
MSTRHAPAVTLVVLLALGIQASSPTGAYADDPLASIPPPSRGKAHLTPAAIPSSKKTNATQAALPQAFEFLLNGYISAFYANNSLETLDYQRRLSIRIWASPSLTEYQDLLHAIDQNAKQAPEAIFDLARVLQLEWEASHTHGLAELRLKTITQGAESGALVGLFTMGLIFVTKGRAAPRYFSLWRRVSPLIPVALGTAAGWEINQDREKQQKALQPSPAQIMHLGIENDDAAYEEKELLADLASLGVSLSVGAAASSATANTALRLLKSARLASTPLKANVYGFIAGTLIGGFLDTGVQMVRDTRQNRRLREQVLHTQADFERASLGQDLVALFQAADQLFQASRNLSLFYTPDGSEGEKLPNTGIQPDADYEDLFVLKFVSETQEALLDPAESSALIAPLGSNAIAKATVFARNPSKIPERISAKYRQLADELRAGQIRGQDPTHILLQAAAVIRSSRQDYVQSWADQLEHAADLNDLALRTTLTQLAEEARTSPGHPELPEGGVPEQDSL